MATACGVFSVLTPLAVAPALAIFVAAVWMTQYISLGSVLASLALPPLAYAIGQPGAGRGRGGGGAAALIVFRHRSNLARLRPGTERRRRGARRDADRIAVLGAGSWGTALAVHLARVGHDVRLWARDRGARRRDAPRGARTPCICRTSRLPDSVAVDRIARRRAATTRARRLGDSVARLPRASCGARRRTSRRGRSIVSATKGLEADTLLRMSEVIAQELGAGASGRRAVGSELRRSRWRSELPTAVLAASANAAAIELVQAEFRGPYFRLYGSDDVVGVEIGGALKNVIAIAAGVVEGLGLGHNALAALITRGLAEITRLACAAGGRRETLAG